MDEKMYEKHAWILLLVVGIISLIPALILIVTGTHADPAAFESVTGMTWSQLQASSPRVANFIGYVIRAGGAWLLVAAVFTIAVSLKSYRKEEKWAWYTLWVLPVIFVFGIAVQSSLGLATVVLGDTVLLATILLGLLLPYRKFFPRKQP